MSKQTCGPLYKKQFDHFTGGNPDLVRVFAAGFVSGQAEKIYLGACAAAMFRPAKENLDLVLEIVEQVKGTYGLYSHQIDEEIWLFGVETIPAIAVLANTVRETRAWHLIRGMLTGVPLRAIDYEFHKRHGFGEACDR